MTYPTLSEVMDAVKKRDADILLMSQWISGAQKNMEQLHNHNEFLAIRITRLAERVAQLEGHGKQFEKIGQ